MTTVQSKFFRLLDERAEAAGFELAVAYDFSNKGTLHLQQPDSFETALSVPFAFQPDRATFGWMGAYANPHRLPEARPLFEGRPNRYYAIFKPAELDQVIEIMLTAAKGGS